MNNKNNMFKSKKSIEEANSMNRRKKHKKATITSLNSISKMIMEEETAEIIKEIIKIIIMVNKITLKIKQKTKEAMVENKKKLIQEYF